MFVVQFIANKAIARVHSGQPPIGQAANLNFDSAGSLYSCYMGQTFTHRRLY